jgi:hypothetical protein
MGDEGGVGWAAHAVFFLGLSVEDNEKNSIEKFVVYLSSSMG